MLTPCESVGHGPASFSNTAPSLNATAMTFAEPSRRHMAPAEQVRSADTAAHSGLPQPLPLGLRTQPDTYAPSLAQASHQLAA
jgi:hypothetical protein